MDIERWHKHILRPLLDGEEPTANPDELGGLALLAADTDRTQDYVFESVKSLATLGEIADTLREVFGKFDEVLVT